MVREHPIRAPDSDGTIPSYRPSPLGGNAPRILAGIAGISLALTAALLPHRAVSQASEALPILTLLARYARAHPSATGPVTLERHDHAYARTVVERGTLHLTRDGARLTIEGGVELALRADGFEALDPTTSPPLLLVSHAETPFAAYRAILDGADPSALFDARTLDDRGARAVVELVPRAPFGALERIVLRVHTEGADAGRIERALALELGGDLHRIDLERLRHPARIDPSALILSPRPDARRVEL